jgi:hypothetical protein
MAQQGLGTVWQDNRVDLGPTTRNMSQSSLADCIVVGVSFETPAQGLANDTDQVFAPSGSMQCWLYDPP